MSSPNFLNLNPQEHQPSTALNQDATSAISSSPRLQPTDLIAQPEQQVNTKTSRSSSAESADSIASADVSIADDASRVQQGQFLRLGQH